MTRRKRTTMIVLLTVAALLTIAGIAWAAGTFPDVTEDNVHFDAIEWAAANGIVNGYPNGNFGPYDPILRGQAATMFQNYDEYLKGSGGGTSTCGECHDDTDLISGKQAQWSLSLHGEGEVFLEDGGEAGCAGCHSGGGFSAMVAAGQKPNEVTEGDPSPSRQDCRACHAIHVTGTDADWALETTAPVAFYATGLVGTTFDGGDGNLCVNCHQPRRTMANFAATEAGKVAVTNRFGPHHGPQSAMLLGLAGEGAPAGSPMLHYSGVADTCVTCHMGENALHSFAPVADACVPCHGEDFDFEESQAEVQALLDELKAALVGKGMLDAEGAIVPGTYPEADAAALWNWIYVNNEDKSLGVHNPAYTRAILQAGIDALAG